MIDNPAVGHLDGEWGFGGLHPGHDWSNTVFIALLY